MKIVKLNCTACGAPIAIPEEVERIVCTACGTALAIERGEGYATLKLAEKIARAVEATGQGTQEAIRESTNVTRAEFQRLQLTQELSTAEMKLANIQAEMRMVQRESVKGKAQPELAALRLIEFQVMDQMRGLKKQLNAADPQDLPAALELAAWELAWLENELDALRHSSHPQRELSLQVLLNEKQSLEQSIFDLKTRILKGRYRSFQVPDPSWEDPQAITALLGMLDVEEAHLRNLPNSPEGQAVYAQVVERQQAIRAALRRLNYPLPAQAGAFPAVQAGYASGGEAGQKIGWAAPARGCLAALPILAGFLFLGFIVFGALTSVASFSTDAGAVALFIFAIAGVLLGTRAFLLRIAPGVAIRGALGLPDLVIRSKQPGSGAPHPGLVKAVVGASAWATFYLLILILYALADKSRPAGAGGVVAMGILLGPLVAWWVARRTSVG